MRLRTEKGLWNGGLVPFGFRCDVGSGILYPDEENSKFVEQMFCVYVERRSDFAVRDWLKAHQIPAPNRKPVWTPRTIRDLICNRRYIGQIEINKQNKGLDDLPAPEMYRVVAAPYRPIIAVELFELAQMIRREKAVTSPNRKDRAKSGSRNCCGRVYPLQGVLTCACYGSAMTPYYVHHKPGHNRRSHSYIYYYLCAEQSKGWKQCGHRNLVLAKIAENWILGSIEELVSSPEIIERSIETAREKCRRALEP